MEATLSLRGTFSAECPEAPLQFEPGPQSPDTQAGGRGSEPVSDVPALLKMAATATAAIPEMGQVAISLLDGAGGLWLLEQNAMPFHLRACLDRIADQIGHEAIDWGLFLIIGIAPDIPAEQASNLESLLVGAASRANGGRYPLGYMAATILGKQILTHIFDEQEVAGILTGKTTLSPTTARA